VNELETLKAMDTLLADETKWTTETLARSEAGVSVPVEAPLACRWCLVGAYAKVKGVRTGVEIGKCAMNLGVLLGLEGLSVGIWNDSHTFADVKELLAARIQELERTI
jgi:hypothetical protein